jgi:hypothetical protein
MANKDKLQEDLKFIKKKIEESARYKNIPWLGYVTAGVLGLVGGVLTFGRLGMDKLENLSFMGNNDIFFLAFTWSLVFVLAAIAVLFFSARDAKKSKTRAWNALAARLFLSKIPVVLVAGILTIALTAKGIYDLVPAVWLLCYSIVVFSFSYFTGIEHRIQGFIFLIFGTCAAFVSAPASLIFLSAGFGGVNILFGAAKLLKLIGRHGTE